MEKLLTSIHGIIIPSKWDDNGRVLSLKVLAFDENQFEILDNQTSKILFKHIRETVTVYGNVIELKDEKQIRVSQFIIHTSNF